MPTNVLLASKDQPLCKVAKLSAVSASRLEAAGFFFFDDVLWNRSVVRLGGLVPPIIEKSFEVTQRILSTAATEKLS